jgi:hypothetical protein
LLGRFGDLPALEEGNLQSEPVGDRLKDLGPARRHVGAAVCPPVGSLNRTSWIDASVDRKVA